MTAKKESARHRLDFERQVLVGILGSYFFVYFLFGPLAAVDRFLWLLVVQTHS